MAQAVPKQHEWKVLGYYTSRLQSLHVLMVIIYPSLHGDCQLVQAVVNSS